MIRPTQLKTENLKKWPYIEIFVIFTPLPPQLKKVAKLGIAFRLT